MKEERTYVMRKELWLLLLLVVLGLVMGLLNPNFFSANNVQNNLRLVGMYGLLSLGVGLTIMTGGIDLSVGSGLALLGVLLVALLNPADPTAARLMWPVAVAVVLAGGGLIGLVHGLLVTRMRLQPFIVTLCGLLIYRGVARTLTGDTSVGLGTQSGFEALGALARSQPLGVPIQFWLMLGAAVVLHVLLNHTVHGRYLLATGCNEEAARYSGISTRRVVAQAYIACGVLTGAGAVLFAFYTNVVQPSSHGNFYELYAIAGAVLGGCSLRGGEGSIIGIVLGAILLVLLRNVVNLLGIASSLDFAVMGAVILLGVIVDQLVRRRAR